MRIDILYFEGCPNHGPTLALVREVIHDLRVDVPVREVEVRNEDDASRLRFLGSPTVQIDGCDIEPAARTSEDFSMSCRVYGSSGVPPRALIETALRRESAL